MGDLTTILVAVVSSNALVEALDGLLVEKKRMKK